tara:strand:+ start:478 stop:585 length:108 start_codon:yes stop_codon:yes gene_type:complete
MEKLEFLNINLVDLFIKILSHRLIEEMSEFVGKIG